MNSKYSCWVYQIRAIVVDDDSTISSYIPFRHKHILFSFVLRVCTVSKYLWKFFHIKSKHYGLEMIYPDEEKITYSYNLGGQLEKVHGYKSYGYDYVSKIGYDKFEQRTYLKYCNGAETFYTYDPQRRRLQNLMVNSGGNTIMDNVYTYDANSKYINKKINIPTKRNCSQVTRTYLSNHYSIWQLDKKQA